MLTWPAASLQPQTNNFSLPPIEISVGSSHVKDVFVLPHGASFFNTTDSTYFAIPRYRVVKMLASSQLVDSIQAAWQARENIFYQETVSSNSKITFWRSAAYVTAAGFIISLVIHR
jgi:hypothetical protein